jgi:hypothetical protein
MREDVSRRKALSMLGIALGVALASTRDAEAQTAGTKTHHNRPTVQPASAPAEAAPAEFKPTNSPSNASACRAQRLRGLSV